MFSYSFVINMQVIVLNSGLVNLNDNQKFRSKLFHSKTISLIYQRRILKSYRLPFFCLHHPLSLVTSLEGDNWAILAVVCYVLFYSKIWNNSILAVILWNNDFRFERSKYKPRHIEWKLLCVPAFSRNLPILLLT